MGHRGVRHAQERKVGGQASHDLRKGRKWSRSGFGAVQKLQKSPGASWERRARRRRPPGRRQARLRAAESRPAGLRWRESGARRQPPPGGVVIRLWRDAAAPVEPSVRERECKSSRRICGIGLVAGVPGDIFREVAKEGGDNKVPTKMRGVGLRCHVGANVKGGTPFHITMQHLGGSRAWTASSTTCRNPSRSGQLRGTVSKRGTRSKMPRHHCVRSAGASECSTPTRRRGKSWRKAGEGSSETPLSELDRAGEGERRRVAGSAAVAITTRRSRVRG
ncbi:hypothetical protein Emag_007335 [Eimeria magna]